MRGAAERVHQRHAQRAVQVGALAPKRRVGLLGNHKYDVCRRRARPLVACAPAVGQGCMPITVICSQRSVTAEVSSPS